MSGFVASTSNTDNMTLLCFGTRPEWLKIKPLINQMERDSYQLLFTGQHPDLLKDIRVDYAIQIKESTNRLDQLISDCLLQFPEGTFNSVLVQGDTASAFACAVAAFNRRLRIYYLEAGLRSYNLDHPYPEEAYRQMIARIADINFTPTKLSADNLINERVSGMVYITGNTVLDNLVHKKLECEYLDKVLITMHRRENHHWMDQWFEKIDRLAEQHPHIEFILPIHPNPNVQKHRHKLTNVQVVDPLEHDELLNLLVKCKLVITDSGGLQEEGSFFNKKVIVCRTTTERPEAIHTGHLHLCESPQNLLPLFEVLLKNYAIDTECPYGDGNSAAKIINHINTSNGNL
jgi:UDP-N-acetylglucosamine 2-epimerase (non-hydrolysing)